jgi:hypothetical protein
MAITVLGMDSLEGGLDGSDGTRTARLTYRSRTDVSPGAIGDVAVQNAVVLSTNLGIGSTYPFDGTSYCKSIRTQCLKRLDKSVPVWDWLTTYEFTSKVDADQQTDGAGGAQNGFSSQPDRSLRAPKISVSVRTFEKPVTTDTAGNRVENSAGDPFVRTKRTGRVVFRWEKFMRRWKWEYNQPAPTGYLFSRNAGAWAPAGPYTSLLGTTRVDAGMAMMTSIQSEISFEGGGGVNVSCEIETDPDAFADIVLDQGFFHLVQPGVTNPDAGQAPTTVRRRFVDRNGVQAGPQLLDGAGGPLGPRPAVPVNRAFQYYELKNWNAEPWGPVNVPGRFFALPTQS